MSAALHRLTAGWIVGLPFCRIVFMQFLAGSMSGYTSATLGNSSSTSRPGMVAR